MTTTATTPTSTAEANAAAEATAAAEAKAKAAAKAPSGDVQMTASPTTSDSESDEDSSRLPWLLGFVEPPASPLSLLRHHFRSKVGGRPAWLDPCSLPTPSQLCCGATGAPLDFLCQVYAPLDESESESDGESDSDERRGRRRDDETQRPKNKHEDAFHRAIYVFVGPSGSSLADGNSPSGNRSVRALRCQLPRRNEHYSPSPPPGGDVGCPPPRLIDPSTVTNHDRWRVAECEASIVAAAAEAAAAASVSGGGAGRMGAGGLAAAAGGGGQVAAAEAEAAAGAAAAAFSGRSGSSSFFASGSGAGGAGDLHPAAARLFPEAELVVEEEGSDCGSDLEEAIERAKETAAVAAAAPSTPALPRGDGVRREEEDEADAGNGEEDEADVEMMESVEAAVHPDAAAMARFSARVARAPSQVLRYRFDRRRRRRRNGDESTSGSAIWPRAHPGPPKDCDVPPCGNCGAPRALEFQLLPQMLNFLGCDAEDERAPDWSCVGVWSCVESCSLSGSRTTASASSGDGVPPPISKTGGAGISGGPSAYIEEFVWVQPSDAQRQQRQG